MPNGEDERLKGRDLTLLSTKQLSNFPWMSELQTSPNAANTEETQHPDDSQTPGYDTEEVICDTTSVATGSQGTNFSKEITEMENLWTEHEAADDTYLRIKEAVQQNLKSLPPDLKVKVSLSECALDERNQLLFRDRLLVPANEQLRTGIIHEAHDAFDAGHPGREGTYHLVMRRFFWPGMSNDIRRFCENCDKCRSNHIWRDRRAGLLKPLPIPDRQWRHISIDFIEKLNVSNGFDGILVITDRLTRGVILEPVKGPTVIEKAKVFITEFYRRHGMPSSIVSDRGRAFESLLWTRMCELLQIKKLMSTAYHPKTNGGTERLNASVETYIRIYTDYYAEDWSQLLPACELALNNRSSTSIGMSPFFLSHGYDLELVPSLREKGIVDDLNRSGSVAQAERIVKKLRDAQTFAETMLAASKEQQENASNKSRNPARRYEV